MSLQGSHRYLWIALILGIAQPQFTQAGKLPERFTLGRYLPGDAWVYIHLVNNPERDWVKQEWAEVFDALKNSGLQQDLMSLVLSKLPASNQQQRDEMFRTLGDRVAQVPWSKLWSQEVAFAKRLSSGKFGADNCLLMRGDRGSGRANFNKILALLKELEEVGENFVSLTRLSQNTNAEQWNLRVGEAQGWQFNLHLFRLKDIIGVTNSQESAQQVLRRMLGKSASPPIAASKRFISAVKGVTSPEDAVIFFDVKRFMGSVKQMTHRVRGHDPSGNISREATLAKLVNQFCRTCNVMDYMITSMDTDGRRQRGHTVTRLQRGKEKCHLAGALLCRKPFKRFDQYIPASATSFNLSGSFDLEKMYTLVTDFIAKANPTGEGFIQQLSLVFESLGFDPKRDLFSWWSGEMITLSLPPEMITPMRKSDLVLMVRVKDTQLAAEKVDALLTRIAVMTQGQGLTISPAPVSAQGFRQISHPIIMMFARPVVGVYDGWLFLSTSADAVNKCLAVSAKHAPSITSNLRFKREGLIPSGPVLACSFKDTSNYGREKAATISMVGMVASMATMSMPNDLDLQSMKQSVQMLTKLLHKLGPVFQKIDFLSSQSAMTVYDGELTVTTKTLVTYKEPDQKRRVKTVQRKSGW